MIPQPKLRAIASIDAARVRKVRDLLANTTQRATVAALKTDAPHLHDMLTGGRFSPGYVERMSAKIDEAWNVWKREQEEKKGAAE